MSNSLEHGLNFEEKCFTFIVLCLIHCIFLFSIKTPFSRSRRQSSKTAPKGLRATNTLWNYNKVAFCAIMPNMSPLCSRFALQYGRDICITQRFTLNDCEHGRKNILLCSTHLSGTTTLFCFQSMTKSQHCTK